MFVCFLFLRQPETTEIKGGVWVGVGGCVEGVVGGGGGGGAAPPQVHAPTHPGTEIFRSGSLPLILIYIFGPLWGLPGVLDPCPLPGFPPWQRKHEQDKIRKWRKLGLFRFVVSYRRRTKIISNQNGNLLACANTEAMPRCIARFFEDQAYALRVINKKT